ncbi:phage tail protein [Acinetobacter tjernbergiae]|uniref:Phage tail collar domain-containing protein n=1 Tax=Acinetobacter tjernbergiae DSM 14971 = CIP 107465 TaxID=1120928 RepID=V2V5K1_9GAMM|nr:phage tail protein [Acinetobacter tjernbergiae]ESK57547.1 hypothetical protein F990_00083 [Acinetobacter tjernbergiae DSM 14971 = CIP 107465]
MERINSVNARANVNGAGKKGFHDNADLSGQDATYINPSWCNHIQEEIAGVVEVHEPLDPNNKNQLKAALFALFATNENVQEVDSRLTAAITALASAIQPFLIKTGTMELWTNSVCPAGYLECNGNIYPISSYPNLFAVIGNTFGGDGVTTFAVPNMIDNFARGWDHIRAFGSFQKATSVFMGDPSVTAALLANLYNTSNDNPQTLMSGLNGEVTTIDPTNIVVLSSPAQAIDPVPAIDTTMSVRPRNLALMFIIKT